MAPRSQRHPSTYEDLLTSSLAEDILSSADTIAASQGGPSDTRHPTSREAVRAWGTRDPLVDYDTFLARLLNGGVPPEESQRLAIVRQYPEVAQALAQPESPEQAQVLAALAEYPYRHAQYAHLDPDERVQYATRLDREWQKSLDAPAPTIDPSMLGG